MRTDFLCAGFTFSIVFVIYFLTSAPGLGLVDSGELTTVALKLGISHPTGYPLYTLLGRVWLMFGFAAPDRAMVIFSVFTGSFACAILSVIALTFFESIAQALPRSLKIVGSISLPLTFALSLSAWTSTSFTEVYPLTWLLTCLIVWISQNLINFNSELHNKYLYLLAYLWGLAFGNHLTVLWLFPIVLYSTFCICKIYLNTKLLVNWVLLFLLGTSVNLYLPIRSLVEPVLDWSDPQTFSGLFKHLTAWQYRVWMFRGNFSGFLAKIGIYLKDAPLDLGIGITLFAMIGILYLLKSKNKFLLILLSSWMIGIVYNLNYDIPDISTYFITYNCILFCISIVGFSVLAKMIYQKLTNQNLSFLLLFLLAVLPAVSSFASTYRDANQNTNRFAVNLTKCVLNTLPDSALVLQGNWDIQSPYLYLQKVENFRTDIAMFDMNLLQRGWYLKQEQRLHPDIFADSQTEIRSFLNSVKPFESGENFDGTQIENAFVKMNNKIIESNKSKRPIYIRYAKEIGHPGIGSDFKGYPAGFFYRLSDSIHVEKAIDITDLIAGVRSFDNRERYLLDEIASFSAIQGTFAISRLDTQTVRSNYKTCNVLASEHPLSRSFLMKAGSFLKIK